MDLGFWMDLVCRWLCRVWSAWHIWWSLVIGCRWLWGRSCRGCSGPSCYTFLWTIRSSPEFLGITKEMLVLMKVQLGMEARRLIGVWLHCFLLRQFCCTYWSDYEAAAIWAPKIPRKLPRKSTKSDPTSKTLACHAGYARSPRSSAPRTAPCAKSVCPSLAGIRWLLGCASGLATSFWLCFSSSRSRFFPDTA